MKRFLASFLLALGGGVVAIALYKYLEEPQVVRVYDQVTPPVVRTSLPSFTNETMDFVFAAENTVNAVVHVKTTYQGQVYYNPFGKFFGNPYYQAEPTRSSGSGVILSPDGYIVTNNHVITGAQQIEVTLNDNQTYAAELVGADPATDLAVIKIKGNNLPTIQLGDSDNLRIGEWVLAVGNPFNLTSTVTAGIVSAKARNINILEYDPNRDIFPIESFIQTDAAVNPGNSGGALVNVRGELVGINTAIASRTGSYSGYSFAVPVSIVKKVTNDLLEFGNVQRAYIGVNISNITQELAGERGLPQLSGAYVRGLMEGGAAADAGIREGDIITSVQGIAVRNVTELQEQVGKFRPGDRIDVSIIRNKQAQTLPVILKNREGDTSIKLKAATADIEAFGAILEKVDRTELEQLQIAGGVRVKKLNKGQLAGSGMKEGFIITKIDHQLVREPGDVNSMLEAKKGGILIEGIYPNGVTAYYGFGL